ncbi:MAG: hypothetical protein RL299_1178 [Pseudomonadota bacterium]
MKFNPIYAVGGLFVTGVVAAGAWLLQVTNDDPVRPSPTADPELVASASPPAPPAPPKDENFVIKRVLPITGPIKYGEWHWDDKDVPDGPLVITVDLDARVLSIFKGGYEIGASAVLLGTSEKPTPTGIFPIKWKKKDHYSSIYDGAPMPYTMNLTDDGIAIHGTKVEKGYASHGCIGLPDPFVAKIFAIAPVGTKVYITKGKMVKQGDSLI